MNIQNSTHAFVMSMYFLKLKGLMQVAGRRTRRPVLFYSTSTVADRLSMMSGSDDDISMVDSRALLAPVSSETFQRPLLQRFASDASSAPDGPTHAPPIDLDWRQQRQRATETPSPPRGRLRSHSARGNFVSQPGIFTV